MTEQQKSDIIKLRKKGTAFSAIAEQLSLSINTVKSFYRRNSTADKQSMLPTCKYCGKRLIQPYGKREKKYCSDKCRFLWWNGHLVEWSSQRAKEKNGVHWDMFFLWCEF